jgi:hypothetical protein
MMAMPPAIPEIQFVGDDIRGSVSSNRSVLNMKRANIARRITLNAVRMVVPYSDDFEPKTLDGECTSSRYPNSFSRFYAAAFQRIISETKNGTIIFGKFNACLNQRLTLRQSDR